VLLVRGGCLWIDPRDEELDDAFLVILAHLHVCEDQIAGRFLDDLIVAEGDIVFNREERRLLACDV